MELVDHPSIDLNISQETKSKRGRPLSSTKTFHYWTRVLSVSHRPIDFRLKFDVAEDLEEEKTRQEEEKDYAGPVTDPIFHPKSFITDKDKPML